MPQKEELGTKQILDFLTELLDTYVWETENISDCKIPPQLSKRLGLTESEISLYFLFTKIHPADRTKLESEIDSAKNGQNPEPFELKITGADGNFLHFKVGIRYSKYSVETPGKYTFLFQEITKPKADRESLRQSNRRLKLATKVANVGIWDLDLTKNVLVWDEEMYNLYGIHKTEFSGAYEAWEKSLHPEDKTRAIEDFYNAVAGRKEFDTEFRILWPDGSVHYIKAIAAVFRDSEGNPIQMIGTNWDITRIKLADQESRKTQENLARVNEIAKIGTWDIDFISDKTYWSKKTKEIFEIPEDHSPKLQDFIRFAEEGEDKARMILAIESALHSGTDYDMDLQIRTVSGRKKWVRTIGHAEFTDGKCVRLFGIFQDIEERRKIENNLVLSELMFRGAFENNGIGMALVSSEGKWLKVNRKLCEMLGYAESEFYSLTFQDITHPEDLEKDLSYVNQILNKEIESYKMEKRYFKKDGSIIWINLSVSSVRDKFDNFLYFVSQIEDITEKKAAEQSLITINHEMKQIFDSATQVAIIKTDLQGVITVFSKGAENLFGYSEEELVGKYTPEILHDKEDTYKRGKELSELYKKEIKGFDIFSEVAKRESYDSRIWKYRRKDGTVFPAQMIITAVKGFDSKLSGFLGIGTDVSGAQEYLERLEDTKQQLEILADQLGRKNAQLLNYAHITSHNLRAPTSNLISLVELVEEAKSEEEIQSLLGKFKISVDYLQETLDSLVEVLKIQEGTRRKIETVRFDSVLKKILRILEGQILETSAEIHSDFSPLEELEYDKTYLESILLNLISNSIKYRSPHRTPKIDIRTEISEGKYLLIVEDNGLGIDLKKYQNKLFGLHKTFHRHPDARGVGLFLTKSQVEALNGRIYAESELDHGTKMIIELQPLSHLN
ncbi:MULTISPECIES: PAS domain-containing sensor histidine kinase [unclassified Leptospira]|uniref:PAS domain-containing sensor histidine kinase n=1 Tax=unclassified Leptospira TaxID=2633828 RepID=UPI0002C00D7B|nr:MULTISPECIES: PAS domain-containing sensor histidine kinase [unclassified Leptospira]EMK01773.1 PAS domain S-box protein [Leptospira sp. B5-022]